MKPTILAKEASHDLPPELKPYRLAGTERLELLTAMQARVRNRNRTDNKRWELSPESTGAKAPKPILPPKAWAAAFSSGISKDFAAAPPPEAPKPKPVLVTVVKEKPPTAPQGAKDIEMAKKNTKSGAKKSEKKAKAPRASESSRPRWRGHSMCEITRYGGSRKFSHDKICAILDKMGLAHAAVYLERRRGLAGENVPVLTKEDRIEFNKIAEKIPDDIKGWSRTDGKPIVTGGGHKKAAKAEKPAKKAPKVKAGKKARKAALDPEDALDDAAAVAEAVAEDADEE